MPNKRALLFANGEIQRLDVIPRYLDAASLIVAVDGGLNHCDHLGIQPDLLVGDLDSVAPDRVEALSASGTRVEKFPVEKDETDLELALLHVLAGGAQELVLFGGLGGRLDHTLGNLALLFHPAIMGIDFKFIEGDLEIFAIRQSALVHGCPGDLVSLIPWGGDAVGVSTQRMKYPLNDETLIQYRTRGISNVMLSDTAEVKLQQGALLCVHTHTAGAPAV